ncbi:MAG: hypothetical protein DRQ65_06615 [Gammaproteobacteria bacterium]|nr:MAG: hypothetical protein DRQ65_06615 [Gammaproteobacteria bacterium]
MPSDHPDPEAQEVARLLKTRLVLNAAGDNTKFDARAGSIFDAHGLFPDSPREFDPPAPLAQALAEETHPDRIPVGDGPLLVVRKPGTADERVVVEVETFLFSPKSQVREAAIRHFEGLSGSRGLTGRTKKCLADTKGALVSESPAVWRPAAFEAQRALDSDLLLALLGLRQSLATRFDDGIRRYLDQVFDPSFSAIENLDQTTIRPSAATDELEKIIDKCSRCAQLADACDEYYRVLGHVPLSKAWSLGAVVEKWLRHNKVDDLWHELTAWVERRNEFLPQFHLALVFVARPRWLGEQTDRMLVELVAKLLGGIDDPESKLFFALAKHYLCVLSTTFPGGDGETLSTISLWLAREVSGAFASSDYPIKAILDMTVTPVAERSFFYWFATRPPIGPSTLRLSLLFGDSLWALAVASELHRLPKRVCEKSDDKSRNTIGEFLCQHLARCVNFAPGTSETPTFATDQNLAAAGHHWAQSLPSEWALAERLKAFSEMNRSITRHQPLIDALQDLATKAEAEQAVIVAGLRAYSYLQPEVVQPVLDIVLSDEWARQNMSAVSIPVLDMFLDELIELQSTAADDAALRLPHMLADAAEHVDGKDKRSLLITGVVISATCRGSVSVLDRLRKADDPRLREDLEGWRRQIGDVSKAAPPWAAGRLRRVLARLPTLASGSPAPVPST